MAAATTDAQRHREQQRIIWDSVSAGWHRWQSDFEHGAGEATRRLLKLTGPIFGRDVLDVGSGIGEPAISAATAAVGGRVVSVDLSPAMVALARAAGASHNNLSFHVGDLESMELPEASFDVVISRWALPFAADRTEMLCTIGRLLRPGGILAATVWGEPKEAPAISLAFRIICEQLGLPPPPPGPGPFSMSNSQELAALLEDCGFREVEITNLVVPFRFNSIDDFTQFSQDVLPPGMRQQLVDRVGSVEAPRVWEEFREAAVSFEDLNEGIVVPSITRCVRAVVAK